MISLPRSGTHWLKRMIAHGMGVPPLEKRLIEIPDLERALRDEAHERLCYDHFQFDAHGALLDPGRDPNLRLVLLYRHPVDALISHFHKNVHQGTYPQYRGMDGLDALKHQLREWQHLPDREAIPHRRVMHQCAVQWVRSGRAHVVRYEDLVAETAGRLTGVLDYLRVRHTPRIVNDAVVQNRFEVLSGGRKPGEVDTTSHFRRGLPGEWRESFTGEELDIIASLFGDHLEALGSAIR